MQDLSTINFRKEFVTAFPGDESGGRKPRQTPGKLYSKAEPTPVSKVSLLAWSDDLARQLDIQKPTAQTDIDILGGNHLTPSMYPYAACYAGHQFGNWAGQLGDGRAITLGEHVNAKGEQWELQLKGAGPTAYSRRADGRAVLRSSVREYLMSEAMFYLGVPTTRALSLVSTGDPVLRDMFYDGHQAYEPGAIVMRVAPSFLRFGNFEMLASRAEIQHLRKLADWTISRYYPHITGEDKILRWYKEVVDRTAKLVVEWQRVGFVHGVMNTDNMSILGLTIDYGPYSFVDNFDPDFTPNTTDLPGRRYAFAKQVPVAKWNLGCLGGALLTLLPDKESLINVLESFDDVYWQHYYAMAGKKIGLESLQEKDGELLTRLDSFLKTAQPDMTIFYRLLTTLPAERTQAAVLQHFSESFYNAPSQQDAEGLYQWVQAYTDRLNETGINPEAVKETADRVNPHFVLRNYLLHQAIEDLQKGDDSLFQKLQDALKTPYENKYPEFFVRRPQWAEQKAGCSMLSCSS